MLDYGVLDAVEDPAGSWELCFKEIKYFCGLKDFCINFSLGQLILG